MASLENVYHDFARLAKQSGFHFQLHRGEVNWSDLENISIDEITEKKNFYLLEQNLINVINCDLEKEYDGKILDKNFKKLFKLAQLGVDYLFYCVMYLDKCVILIQEQLIASQEKCETFTLENQKIKEELNSIKRKNETHNYRCEKCGKSFISDIYLKYHNKSRHNTLNVSERSDRPQKKGVDNWQQTEHERKLTTSTQTLFHEEVSNVNQNNEDESSLKVPLVMKIENLELELQDLKERLKKAENTLSEKTESVKSNDSHSTNISGSMNCNSMLMLLPSYLLQLGNGYYEINPRDQASVPEVGQTNNTPSSNTVSFETTKNKPLTENFSQTNTELKKQFEKGCNSAKEESKSDAPFGSVTDYRSEENDNLESNKENIDLSKRSIPLTKSAKPLPPPRKSKKKKIPSQLGKEQKPLEEPFEIIKSNINHNEKIESFSSNLIKNESTPIRGRLNGEATSDTFEESKDNLSEINKPILNSSASLSSNESEPETEFFIKKVITKNSPKLGKFGKNFKSSLTSFCDSVSFTEKDLNKKESNNQKLKAAVTDKLNNHLRRLGVDPEWRGIPRKTMIQKLNVLRNSRKILSKENPAFLEIRQNIEEKLFQRLKKNLGKKKAVLINKLHKQKAISKERPTTQDSLPQQKSEFVKSKNSVMFDTDTDLESKSSDSESNFNQDVEQKVGQKSIIVEDLISEDEGNVNTKDEFDVSVFQAGGSRSLESVTQIGSQKSVLADKVDEVLTDSYVKCNFLKNSKGMSFTKQKEILSNKSSDGNTDLEKKSEDSSLQFEFSELENAKARNLIIPKHRYTSQSKLTMNDKKKVLFENYGIDFEEELSDSPTDDELWSFRNEWAQEVG